MATVAVEPQIEPSAPAVSALDEQRLVVYGVSWKDYVVLREALDIPGLRMTFYRGALELMTTSPLHERIKTGIGRLVELFALERDVALNGYGSATFRNELRQCGAEPDECYVVGGELKEVPDVVIEVVLTHGGLQKLRVYEGLGVPEVWFWQDDAFHLFRLGAEGYEPIPKSELVPGLDFEALARHVRHSDQHAAVQAFRDELRSLDR